MHAPWRFRSPVPVAFHCDVFIGQGSLLVRTFLIAIVISMSNRLVFGSRFATLIFTVVTSTSMVPVDEFVRSGAYERARAALADCSVSFFPILDEADRQPTRPWVSFASAGTELRYNYRPLNPESGTILRDEHTYPWLEQIEGARYEIYQAPDASMAIAGVAVPGADGDCTRLYIKADPPVLQVGIAASRVSMTQRFLDTFSDLIPSGFSATIEQPAIEPGEGEVIVKVFSAGQPVHGQDVYLRTDPRGHPGRYGVTYGHEHIALGMGSMTPSIKIKGQRAPGQEVRARTDSDGEIRVSVNVGYRGGPEAVIARTVLKNVSCPAGVPGAKQTNQGCQIERAIAVIARHGEFTHFARALGFDEWPEPSESFPFLMTGYTDRHHYNHWIQRQYARSIANTFVLVWRDDAAQKYDTPRYIQMNDMSLEYGGTFHLNGDCLSPGTSAHHTHNIGLDFDISPCYTRGPDGKTKVSAGECWSGGPGIVRIDERILTAYVVGRMGGVILEHSPSTDGVPYHYHIRFPR